MSPCTSLLLSPTLPPITTSFTDITYHTAHKQTSIHTETPIIDAVLANETVVVAGLGAMGHVSDAGEIIWWEKWNEECELGAAGIVGAL